MPAVPLIMNSRACGGWPGPLRLAVRQETMSESTAGHLLGIYRTRLHMVEKGTIRPKKEVVAGMRELVSGLTKLEPNAKISLEIQPGLTLFKVAAGGDLVGKIQFDERAEPA